MKELGINFHVTNVTKNHLYYLLRFLYSKLGVPSHISIKPDCDFVLLQGGGYMSDLFGLCEGCRLLEAISSYKPIVVAPQTFYFINLDFSKILKKITNKIYLFCREEQSFRLLQKMDLPDHVFTSVSHDTAFYFDKSDFGDRKNGYDLLSFRKGSEAKLSFSEKKALIKYLADNGRKIYNIDASVSGTYQDFVKLIRNADRIFTDRLHVGIVGSILEKETFLFPNIYFKNKAVYDYSLKMYSKTRFLNSVEKGLRDLLTNKCKKDL